MNQRLKAAASATAVVHPDADVLTAFSERSLPQPERKIVLEHLARCGECREIVALALPPSEAALQPIARPARGGWLTWPVLRWGLIAAGIIALTSFGVMQYNRRSQMMAYNARSQAASKEAKNVPVSPPASMPAQGQDKIQTPPASVPAEQKNSASSNAGTTPAPETAAPAVTRRVLPRGGPIGGTLPHGPRMQWQQNANNFTQQAQSQAKQLRAQQVPASPPVPATSQAADTSAQYGAMAASVSGPVLESQRIDQQPLQGGHADSRIERIKPASTSIMSATHVLAPGLPAPTVTARVPLNTENSQNAVSPGVSTRWTISSAGGLQRSLDQGSTWQDVDVNNSPRAAANLALVKAPSKAVTNERVATDSLPQNSEVKDSLAKKNALPLVFRAVASNGPDVWAGAAGGLLYHSTDAGSHWTRVVPSASGATLTGDVVSLEFSDPQHGRVVTSTPEIWTTSDAGQFWQKQ